MKHIRQIIGMNQTELAEKIEVTQGTIAKLESGNLVMQPNTERQIQAVFADAGIRESDIALLSSVLQSSKLRQVKKDWKGV